MNDESVNDAQESPKQTVAAGTQPRDNGTEEPSRPASAEELVKKIGDKDTARVIAELLRSQQVASVYIDARSGGVFFGAEAHITGDVIGRSQVKQRAMPGDNTLDETTVGQVLSGSIHKVRNVYVKPPLYDQAQRILAEKHVLVLWGQAHWGKWTTALHLLLSLREEKVFEIAPDINLDELRSFKPEPEQRYVIDTLSPDSAEELNAFVLNRLNNRFIEQNSHLVITVDNRVSLPKMALSDNLVTWGELPDTAQLLEKHLAWYLTKPDTLRARELSQTDQVQQLLSIHLLPGEVDRLAELLAAVARAELELTEALARFKARARQQVASWFENHTKLEERTFMLSLAVLNGANYQAVVQADELLQARIKSLLAKEEPPDIETHFMTRSQRIKEACAHLAQGYEVTEFGRSPVELIVLDNPTFQPSVLYYAWHEYDRLRKSLIVWLRDFGLDPNFDVRTRAAAAAGELSKYGFGYIRREILLPWANHQDRRARAAAALALGIPAWEGEFAPQVLGLLHHWSTLRNNWRLNWTAAAAYGGLVGLRFPDTALRDLYSIAQAEDLRLFGVLSRSVANLFQAGQVATDYYLKVLDALVSWTVNPKAGIVTLTGLLVFLELAQVARIEADSEGGTWPTLLWLVQKDETYRERVASLWRRALNVKSARKPALETLRRWLRLIDDDIRLYFSAEELITILATQGTSRERERLHFYLDRWASHAKEKSASAAKILVALNS